MTLTAPSAAVVWHDLECGGYGQDLAVWLELAARHPGPVLDIGAGTGRVAITLARAGHEVIALDRDAELLAELERRVDGLAIRCVAGDAREFSLGHRVSLCLVPMQTLQLLGGDRGRDAFLSCAAAHLEPDGLLASAIVEDLEPFEVAEGEAGPLPDLREHDGVVYCSHPTAVRLEQHRFVLERRREVVQANGHREVSHDRIELDRVTTDELERQARNAGLRPAGSRTIPATHDHVASQVVMLRG